VSVNVQAVFINVNKFVAVVVAVIVEAAAFHNLYICICLFFRN
jgi:hypothetical protein